jgi:DNA-binding IclR family transcriptional regulator
VRIVNNASTRRRGSSTVAKAVGLLSLLAQHPKGVGLSELSRAAGLHHTTAHRLLWSLHEVGLVECGEDRLYRLGLKILDLARALLGTLELREIAKPVLTWLATASEETAQLATLDRHEMVFLDRVDGPNPVTLRTRLGARAPVHCTSMGKAYLAFAPPRIVDAVLQAAPLTRYTENTFTDPELFRAQSMTALMKPGLWDTWVATVNQGLPNRLLGPDEALAKLEEARLKGR